MQESQEQFSPQSNLDNSSNQSNPQENNLESNISSPINKKSFLKFGSVFIGIILITLGGVYLWNNYLSESAKVGRDLEKKYQKFYEFQKNYEEAMKADTYGGKTPQETLAMFIEALKKEDIELASKYFALNTNEQSEYYLTRKEWEEGLKKLKEEGEMQKIADLLSKAVPAGSVMEGYFGFEIRNENKDLIGEIDMIFNKYSGVWKIESL